MKGQVVDLLGDFYKRRKKDKIWWVDEFTECEDGTLSIIRGPLLFSFDKKKIYDMWQDYPDNLTKEQKEIFDRENPHWVEFFTGKRKGE